MTVEEFFRLSPDDRDAVKGWLREHDLDPNRIAEFKVQRGKIRARIYSNDDEGHMFIVHHDGTRHVRGDGCDPDSCEVAQEWRKVPLHAPCPVAA